MQIHILSTPCDIISFNGQGQLCLLTCAEWRDLSKQTRMSTIQSRTQGKKPCNIDLKIPWKTCSTAHLPFLSPNPKILKAFLKTFPTKMKPSKMPSKRKKNDTRKAKKRGGEKEKSKSQDCYVTFKPKNSKFCFLHMLKLRTLILCIWIRKPWNVWPH